MNELIEKYKFNINKEYTIEVYIENNFSSIINNIDSSDMVDFLLFLSSNNILKTLLYEKHTIITNILGTSNLYNLGLKYYDNRTLLTYFVLLNKLNIPFINKVNIMIEFCYYNQNFVRIYIYDKNYLNLTIEHLEVLKLALEEFYLNNLDISINNLVVDDFVKSFAYNDYKTFFDSYDEVYKTFFINIFKELMLETNTNFIDIKKLDRGSFTNVYEFNDKILKIGNIRYSFLIPNSKYILQPLLRLELKGTKGSFMCIEITQRVIAENITKEDLKELESKLKKENIEYLDLNERNVGRLIKDNYSYLEGESFTNEYQFNGFTTKIEGISTKDDLVCIDLDHIKKRKIRF